MTSLAKRISVRLLGGALSGRSLKHEEVNDSDDGNTNGAEKKVDTIVDGSIDKDGNSDTDGPAFLRNRTVGIEAGAILWDNLERISDDSLVKIVRQLDFWVDRLGHQRAGVASEGVDGCATSVGEGEGVGDGDEDGALITKDEFLDLTRRLVHAATWRSRNRVLRGHKEDDVDVDDGSATKDGKDICPVATQVPKVRFGRTELQMPIITCGGMRLQKTWLPDTVPLLSPSKKTVLRSDSHRNLKDVVRTCLNIGLNHFETARFYGTSEMQFVDALGDLMDSGEIRREDFIFQTKVVPVQKRSDWEKTFGYSWDHIGGRLGYIDLLSFHGVCDDEQIRWVMDESDDGIYAAALKLKKEGKIRYIGFSTHGTASRIMKLIESNKFDYVNIHCHYFGSYHAEGTPDGYGGHGNVACVKRALELDMGVFQISPFDKGGKLYQPSRIVAETIGPDLSPIALASLYSWMELGIHTISVGLARVSDLDEVLEAADMYRRHLEEEKGEVVGTGSGKERVREMLSGARGRLERLAIRKHGREWYEKGLLNVPDPYEECTDGIHVGHLLWLHNLLSVYGMYDFAKDRYKSMYLGWNEKKSFKENVVKMPPFNPGRPYSPKVDLTKALERHHDPELVKIKIAQVDKWLSNDKDRVKDSDQYDDDKRKEMGWDSAYSLTVWEEYPGSVLTATKVLLQNLTGGRMGITGTGPTKRFSGLANGMRTSIVRRASSAVLADAAMAAAAAAAVKEEEEGRIVGG